GAWARINSKYDGLLAANLNPDYPDERRMLLIRCRAWLVFQGFSQEISLDCQQQFRVEDRYTGVWHFSVPCGQGQHVDLDFCARMIEGENRVSITASRLPAQNAPDLLPDERPVQLIIRPDIDHRSFHANTKAYLGPEHEWPQKCRPRERGFAFAATDACRLQVSSSSGRFVSEPEWQYMQYLPVEEERGMDPYTDLFSPGYFALTLAGSGAAELQAQADGKGRPAASARTGREPGDDTGGAGFEDGLQEALSAYIVPRRRLHTVIAGYPWFLDWGRDTLIVTRGLIAADRFSEAETILLQFAEMESGGTLPNMIRGNDAQNRDTSDAPLWFFVACAELVRACNNAAFLEKSAGGRSIRQVLASIAEGYIGGTPNGIRMDPESGLIYSPPHFTWMDTNHPAGSPRQGYPIEIQALWHFALGFMARCDEQQQKKWQELAGRVQDAVAKLFVLPDTGWLADCLHAEAAAPASAAAADDALRPNQLFAVTLGAVTDREIQRRVLASCMELLVPGAIRSLADRPVAHPLPISRDGRLLNDPHHPYQGVYTGDEDTSRKPAYHNGTAWTWVFPSFCEAWVLAYGESAKYTALSWLASSSLLINAGCAGQVPEIVDGDWPHMQRGCDAQAWGVSELLRVWLQLTE
ncbi:MAG TPA: amylo-alpha-1,6-glucosidase, partial [Desulfosalsimonadaceae bacterium]|nr:amylo-alpha-1,6-glucosidase [Desulfosalsimonadaceae bacterium]